MKNALRIARTELRLLIYSPIAWVLSLAFVLQLGMAYFGILEDMASNQEKGGYYLRGLEDLTRNLFSVGIFSDVMRYFYIYVPLLTMSLFSRETSSGTIKLLYSSPLKPAQIVAGKYLSVVFFGIILMLLLSVFTIAGMFHIRNVDSGILLSSSIGFFLVICTYCSIGLFMSSLTSYQIVSAIASILAIAMFSYIGKVWQGVDIVRNITYYLAIEMHSENLMNGLLTSSDVLYFLVIIYIFLAFTYLRVKGGMESQRFYVKAGRVLIVLVSGIAIGYTFSRPVLTKYLDLSADKRNTLTPQLQEITKKLDSSSLEVITYGNLIEKNVRLLQPIYHNQIISSWSKYLRFKPNINFSTVYYYDEPIIDKEFNTANIVIGSPNEPIKERAREMAESMNIDFNKAKSAEQLKNTVDLKSESNRYFMYMKYNGRSTYLRVFEDPALFPLEAETGAAFKRLLLKQVPKIYCVTGHYERSIEKFGNREYRRVFIEKTMRSSLINNGFDTDTLNLEVNDVPDDASIVVVADPKSSFSHKEKERLQEYIDRGGDLLVAGEPGKQAILNPLINGLGISFMNGRFVQPTKDNTPEFFQQSFTSVPASFSSEMKSAFSERQKLETTSVLGISISANSAFVVQPLVLTDKQNSWLSNENLNAAVASVQFNAANGDKRESLPAIVALSRKIKNKQQRIIVSGDADFLSNELVEPFGHYYNFVFATSLFRWFTNGEFPIDAPRPKSKDNRVNVSLEIVDLLRIPFIGVFPALLAVAGIIILVRRKRK